MQNTLMKKTVFEAAQHCLLLQDVNEKLAAATQLYDDWCAGKLSLDKVELAESDQAGRPEKPELVDPRDVPKRKFGSPEGRAIMIHAVAHIEFNAINLACDAAYRFRDMPEQYYADWLQVAAEEAYHFSLIEARLQKLGHRYGDYAAHGGLWDLALKTKHDVLARMALVPRVMEARGLDVTPGMMERFGKNGDQETVDILKIILRDEIGHVKFGTRWFKYACEQRGLDSETTYFELLNQYFAGGITCPLHKEARLDAGFSPEELVRLEEICKKF